MDFYIPPQRARAIWQEYLDRRALEEKKKLEMANKILTWYSDLESEVSHHFCKALESSAAKRDRLAAGDSPLSSSLETLTGSNKSCQAVSSQPLPSMFPPLPAGVPPPIMTYPDYFHYTDEVDPFISDHSPLPPTSENGSDFSLSCDQLHWVSDEPDYIKIPELFCSVQQPPSAHNLCGSQVSLHSSAGHSSEPPSLTAEPHWSGQSSLGTAVSTDEDILSLTHGLGPSCSYDVTRTAHSLSPSLPSCRVSDLPPPSSVEHTSSSSEPHPPSPSLGSCSIDLSFDLAIYTSDDVTDSDDDIIDNIQLDWTEEEANELKAIVV